MAINLGKYKTMNEAYYNIAQNVINSHKVKNTHEIQDAFFTVKHPMNNLVLMRSDSAWGLPITYNLAELIWYYSSNNNTDYIGSFASLWNQIKNADGTVNSAYGYILQKKFGFNQIDTVIKTLNKDVDTRRATIKFNTPHYEVTDDNVIIDESNVGDEVCTMYADFTIRNNKLNMFVAMRSNDIWSGLTADCIYFTSVQQYILQELNKMGHNYEIGEYTHLANSLHVYDRNLEQLQNAIDNYEPNKIAPGYINYDVLYNKTQIQSIYDKIIYFIKTNKPSKKELRKFTKQLCLEEKLLVINDK